MNDKSKKNPFKRDPSSSLYKLIREVSRDEIINMALKLINRKFVRGLQLASPHDTRNFLKTNLAEREQQV
jgi:hypothetical protein